MPLSHDIRDETAKLLAFEIDLRDFEDWLVEATWNVHQDEDAAAAAPLAYKIELLLSELSGGYRTEEEVRAGLARLLQDDWAEFAVFPSEAKVLVFSGAGTERGAVLA
jgi:hypothetical protein